MSDLSSWEQKNIEILTSKEIGEWLERREKRMPVVPVSVIEGIKAEIENHCCFTIGTENDPAITLHDVFEIIDRHIKEYKAESEG